MSVAGTGAWQPNGTGVHHSGTSFDVVLCRPDAPAARIRVQVAACDLDDGRIGVYVNPLFAVYDSPAAAAAGDASHAVLWFEDTDPLPGFSYQALSDADQAAGDLAAGIAVGDTAALAALGSDLPSLIFAWDGGPPEFGGEGH